MDAETDVTAAVSALLEPAQAETLIEHSLADQALWREIFENLLLQLEQNTPAVPVPAAEAADPLPPAPGRGNIYDMAQPAD